MSQIPRVKSRKILKEKNDENDRSRVWRAREGTEKRERERKEKQLSWKDASRLKGPTKT